MPTAAAARARGLAPVVPAEAPGAVASTLSAVASGAGPPPHAAQMLAKASAPTTFLTSILLDPRSGGPCQYNFQTQIWSTLTRIVQEMPRRWISPSLLRKSCLLGRPPSYKCPCPRPPTSIYL